MTTAEHAQVSDRRISRDVAAGIVGLAAAAAMVLITLRLQDYCTPNFVMVALFVFPVPVACGLAVGLISPRHAIVWAPVWAIVFTMLLFTLLHGGIRDAQVALSPWRMVFMAAGAVLAAAAGLAGQYASLNGQAVQAAGIFLALCCLMGVSKYALISQQMREFERVAVPEVLLAVDRDYIRLPEGLRWRCERQPGLESYRLSTQLDGRALSVTVSARAASILGVSYERDGSARISSAAEARAYLERLGFREPILRSLSRQRGAADSWVASLDGTRLTLESGGRVSMSGLSEILR